MCLGDLAEVLSVDPGATARVRAGGRTATVSLLTLDDPLAPGDWVVCHSGFALSRVTAEAASEAAAIRAHPVKETTTKATTTEDAP
jgi:hydrogenase expression/formation protein HypC